MIYRHSFNLKFLGQKKYKENKNDKDLQQSVRDA